MGEIDGLVADAEPYSQWRLIGRVDTDLVLPHHCDGLLF
jgi:hypothetical protein